MEYREAKEYCIMLLGCRKAIDKAIEKYDKLRASQSAKMVKSLFTEFDPSGDKTTKLIRQEIPFVIVRWGKREDTFKLERPEVWIKTFKESLLIYKSIKGIYKYQWLVSHHMRNVSAKAIAAKYKTTRATVYGEFDEFKNILLCVAIQNGLLTIEKNQAQASELEEGVNNDV